MTLCGKVQVIGRYKKLNINSYNNNKSPMHINWYNTLNRHNNNNKNPMYIFYYDTLRQSTSNGLVQ
jgi:hypothetical protein